jgi:hypothetical protein
MLQAGRRLIPSEVIGFDPGVDSEMSTRNLPGVKGQPELKADNLNALCEPIV